MISLSGFWSCRAHTNKVFLLYIRENKLNFASGVSDYFPEE